MKNGFNIKNINFDRQILIVMTFAGNFQMKKLKAEISDK